MNTATATNRSHQQDQAQAPKPTTVINGVDVQAVTELIEQIKADPSRGMTHWDVTTTWQDGTRSDSRVRSYQIGGMTVEKDFTIAIDEPLELGGTNKFANPQEYLLSALNACMTVGYVAVASLMGIRLSKLEIRTEGDIDLRGFLGIDPAVPGGYRALSYTVHIDGDGTREQFQKLHDIVMATSPNFWNLSRPVTMQPTLVVG